MTADRSAKDVREADRREFQALLDAWAAAIVANDADLIASFAEPDWELVTPESGPVPLERFLGAVRSGGLTHSDMTFEVLSVRRHGAVAGVVAHGTNHGEWNGQPFSADEWVTEVFIHRDGRWRCALSALTPNLTQQQANPSPDPRDSVGERSRPADPARLAHDPDDPTSSPKTPLDRSRGYTMSQLLGIARFTFHEGKVEDFKRLSEQCMEIVRAQDTGTLQYDIYLNDDESEAVVIERYEDSNALMEHLGHIGHELMAAITQTGSVLGETLGQPSEQLRELLADSPVRLFTLHLSL